MATNPNFNKLLLLKGFCNYFDRKIFYYSDIEEYKDRSSEHYSLVDINFNPNDGITTIVDLNSVNLTTYVEEFALMKASYLLVLSNDKEDTIISRWFIMDVTRRTNGIYTLTLKRDVVAEAIGNQTFITQAPIYIEKAKLPESDPLIVNSEGLALNQIKTEETLITEQMGEQTENSPVSYIVGYFANNAPVITASSKSSNPPSDYTSLSDIATATGIPLTKLTEMLTGRVGFATTDFSLIFGTAGNGFGLFFKNEIKIPQSFPNTANSYPEWGETAYKWDDAVAGQFDVGVNNIFRVVALRSYLAINNSRILANLNAVVKNDLATDEVLLDSQFRQLESYEGTVVLYNGEYYYLHVRNNGVSKHPEVKITKGENVFFNDLITYGVDYIISQGASATQYDDWNIYLNYNIRETYIELEKIRDNNIYSVTINSTHNILSDAPYSMFVIPFSNIEQTIYSENPIVATARYPSKQQIFEIVMDIATKWGAGTANSYIYDIQLLPYMPERKKFITFAGITTLDLRNLTATSDYDIINQGESNRAGAILYPHISNESFVIPYPLTMKRSSLKIESQTDFYRLCSPNYNGVFEFNLAKLGGSSSKFYVDCTFKPYNPFIRVTPEFKFLYGMNFKDGRGLICGGDFSLPMISDAWINYELQNKNYASIFSRDIQNLEFRQEQEKFREPFQVAAGAVGATAGGAITGAKVGGIYGAAAGAVIGAGAGIAGGALDLQQSAARRAEEKDYTLDRFNLSLGNIKALANSLSKSSAFNQTSKIFPFLEYYTCTDEEVEILERKIKYDGMTVGRIGFLTNYIDPDEFNYFKGQVIRGVGIEEDSHFLSTLYEEIAKGVYI